MKLEDVIQKPMITEKAAVRKEMANEYFFFVDAAANKNLIRLAVEKMFKVKVVAVHTMNTHGKLKRVGKYMGRRPSWKKAIVTLKEGNSIKIFEGA
ncbi:MAG: 50S ribosomal protein L23 [Deltaproteobacteria bacterium]|nr:50S ribosomal protein L23 [Deltaproteobacteria bacterium]